LCHLEVSQVSNAKITAKRYFIVFFRYADIALCHGQSDFGYFIVLKF